METRSYLVTGLVQGVGFRWYVRGRARGMGLEGWVRNRPDGAVEVMARGAPADLDRLREELVTGPPGARVQRVEGRVVGAVVSLPNPFEIK